MLNINSALDTETLITKTNRSILLLTLAPALPIVLLVFFSENVNFLVLVGYIFSCTLLAAWVWKNDLVIIKEMLQPKAFNIWMLLGAFLLMKVASAGLVYFLEAVLPASLETITTVEAKTTLDVILAIASTVILAPVVEEFIFRGVALHTYRVVRGTVFAIFSTSILFSITHGSLAHGLAVFPLGFVSALLALKTGQLWPSIFLHLLNNSLALAIQQPVSSSSPITINLFLGLIGLLVAVGCLALAWYWLREPRERVTEQQLVEPKSKLMIWTPSLISVVVIYAVAILISTIGIFSSSSS